MGLCRGAHEQAGLAGPAGPADRPQRRGEGSPEYGEVGQRYGQRLPAPLRVGGRYAAHASLFSSGGGGFVYSSCQKYTGSPRPPGSHHPHIRPSPPSSRPHVPVTHRDLRSVSNKESRIVSFNGSLNPPPPAPPRPPQPSVL